METKSQFDLDMAIAAWRDQWADSALNADSLRELETHLRDSVTRIQETGLGQEEAFAIATYRLGQAGPLAAEFAKAYPERVWFTRVLWMLLGAQVFSILTNCATALRGLIAIPEVILRHGRGTMDGTFSGPLLWASHFLVLGGLLIAVFKVLQWKRWVRNDWVQALCREPGKWCGIAAGASVAIATVSFGASMLPMLVENWWSNWFSATGGATHFHYPNLLLMLAISCANATLIPLLTFWFLRRRAIGRLDSANL